MFATLNGHKGDVTTIKIVKEQDRQVTLVSGDSVGEVRVWQQEGRQVGIVVPLTVVPVCAGVHGAQGRDDLRTRSGAYIV